MFGRLGIQGQTYGSSVRSIFEGSLNEEGTVSGKAIFEGGLNFQPLSQGISSTAQLQ